MSCRILVVAAHTDDEALGCAGALARHLDRGCEVYAMHLTDGIGSRTSVGQAERVNRDRAAAQAAEIVGYEWIAEGDFPDNALDSVPLLDVVKFIEEVKDEVEPHLVYTHHGGDLNVDHRVSFQATMTAFRPQPDETCSEIRCFEIPSSTEWSDGSIGDNFFPNLFVDITEYWGTKKQTLEAYSEEMRSFPHARSVEAIDAFSTLRGSQAGIERAESFEIVRKISRHGDL